MPKVICKKVGCKKLIEKGTNNGYCYDHKELGMKLKKEAESYRLSNYNSYRRNSKETKFYNSKVWNELREYVLTKHNYLCQDCLSKDIITTDNLEVHHIIPIKQDFSLALEEDNLKVLCRSCHKKAHDDMNKYKIK